MPHGDDRYGQDRNSGLRAAKLYRRVTEYPKYACKCCKEHGVVSAERPTGLVEGNKYDSSVAAAVVVHKLDMHLPLYRQTDIFGSSAGRQADQRYRIFLSKWILRCLAWSCS